MKQIWLLVAFLAVMLLIGYSWRGDSVSAGAAGSPVSVGAARP